LSTFYELTKLRISWLFLVPPGTSQSKLLHFAIKVRAHSNSR